jgi:hypothetical protein
MIYFSPLLFPYLTFLEEKSLSQQIIEEALGADKGKVYQRIIKIF